MLIPLPLHKKQPEEITDFFFEKGERVLVHSGLSDDEHAYGLCHGSRFIDNEKYYLIEMDEANWQKLGNHFPEDKIESVAVGKRLGLIEPEYLWPYRRLIELVHDENQ